MLYSVPYFMQAQRKRGRHIPAYVHVLFSIRKKLTCCHLVYGNKAAQDFLSLLTIWFSV